ncbi:MAG: hypothetical protein ACI9VT_003293 [Psychroserpens sp.]
MWAVLTEWRKINQSIAVITAFALPFFVVNMNSVLKFLSTGMLGRVHYFVAQQRKICRLVFKF